MNDKKMLIGVVGSTVCLLGLLTSALLPVLSGGSALDYDDFFPGIVVSALGAGGFLGWIVVACGTPSRNWVLPIGLVAAWGGLVGAASVLSCHAQLLANEGFLRSAEERAERYRRDTVTDDKGDPVAQQTVRDERDRAQADVARHQAAIQQKKLGRLAGLVFLVVGVAAGVIFVSLKRRRPALQTSLA